MFSSIRGRSNVNRSDFLAVSRAMIALVLSVGMAFGQSINTSNWGTVTAPVYNQAESGRHSGTERWRVGANDLYTELG